jgi:outer membrane receptor protein involved in Fe transport
MTYRYIFYHIILFCFFLAEAKADEHIPAGIDSIKSSYEISEIEVIAFKSNKNLFSQPVSANILSGELIRELNVQSIKEISTLVPNFYMPEYGSKLTSPVYIRGIGSRINQPSVGLYVDGVPYFDRSSFDFSLSDIDRVEVLRGSQGAIYGRNTMGGVINVFTKSPFKNKETRMNLSGGSYERLKADVSHIGNIDEKFGYALSVNYLHQGGYFENKFKQEMADRSDAVSGRIRLGRQIMPGLTAFLTSAYEYSDQNGYPYGIYNAGTNKTGDVSYDATSYYRRTMSNNGFNIEYKTRDILLASQTSFQYIDGRQGIDQDFTPVDQYYVLFTHDQHMYSQEFNLKSIGEKRYGWQFGAFGFNQQYTQTNDVEYRKLNRESTVNVRNPTLGFALYHQSTINDILVEGLSAIIGLRYDREQTGMENRTTSVDSVTSLAPLISQENTYSRLTPKFSLQYNFDDEKMTFISLGSGFKSGGFNTTAELEKDRVYEPEYNWTYEWGAKLSFPERKIHAEVTLFYIDWKDQQVTQKRASEQGFRLRNAGRSVSKGVEFTSTLQPVKNLNFLAGYGYTHARFKDYMYDEASNIDYGGNYLPMAPRNTLTLAGDYTLDVNSGLIDKVKLNVEYIGTGKIYWSEDNESLQPYYGVLNGQISFLKDNISLHCWAKNITGREYVTFYFESMGNLFAQRSKPFTIGADFNIKF